MKVLKPDPRLHAANRERGAVQRFINEGFPPEKAVRLAAVYLATLRKLDEAPAAQKQASTQTAQAASPIWVPNRKLAPHERVAQRLCEFARMSSEKAHQLAASTAREADAHQRG